MKAAPLSYQNYYTLWQMKMEWFKSQDLFIRVTVFWKIFANYWKQLYETCSYKMRDKLQNFISKQDSYCSDSKLWNHILYVRVAAFFGGPKRKYFLEKFLCFYWFWTCLVSHSSFSSLATYRSFWEKRSHWSVTNLFLKSDTMPICKILNTRNRYNTR